MGARPSTEVLQFLNPLLLFGTLAFAVPLIIHLLNRQRFRRRRWAAMEFLLQAYKKQRRRLRTENLILLLLRCLLPILLALAIARPILQDSGALAGLGGGAIHHVVVLDSTYSMGHTEADGASPFDRAKTLANQLLENVEAEKGHLASVVIAGQFPRRAIESNPNMARARAALVNLARPDDAATDLTAALTDVRELLEQPSEAEPVVYLFTDLQRRALGDAAEADGETSAEPNDDPADANRDSMRDALEALREAKVQIMVFDVGPAGRSGGKRANAQVTSVALRQPAAVLRVPTTVVVHVRNRSDEELTTWVTLDVDEAEPSREQITLPPRGEGDIEFSVTFRETGWRRIRASLESDALEADDACFAVVEVRERLRILVVDGRFEEDPVLRESAELLRFLDPTAGEGPPELTVFAPTVIDPLSFKAGQEDPTQFDAVVLANVDELTPGIGDSLRRTLEAGRGVLLLLGDLVNAQNYNLVLGAGPEGLLPARLTSPEGYQPGGSEYYRSEILRPNHPVLADFDDQIYREILQNVPIFRVMGMSRESIAEETDVLMRVRNPDLTPLLAARVHGDGRLMVLTSTINARPDRWNRLEDPIAALPLLHPLTYWLTLPAVDTRNVQVGTVLSASLAHRPSDVTVRLPERAGRSRAPVGGEPRPLPGGRFALPPWSRTASAGFYLFDMQLDRDGGLEPHALPFAVNVDAADGELEYLAHDVAGQALGVDRIHIALPGDDGIDARSGRVDMGPWFLWALLVVLIAEGSWARFITRRRS